MATTAAPEAPERLAAPPPPPRPLLRERLSRWDVRYSPYAYIAPFFILFLTVGLFPIAYTAYMSLHKWTLGATSGEWVGFENYGRLADDDQFWNAVVNTFSIFLLSSSTQIALALFIATLLDGFLRARTFWRMGVLVPYVVSLVAVGIIFSNLFADQFGLINYLLEKVGLDPVEWHRERLPAHLAIATMVNWRWTGYNALIFLAAMQAIPRDLHEAAAIDGATAWQRFRFVTLPMLRPTFIFVVITSCIGGMQIFTEPRMFDSLPGSNSGGPNHEYQTIVLMLFQEGFRTRRLGYASAIAMALFVIILVVVAVNYLVTRRIATSAERTRR